ncbi:MAG: CRISPR-associated helicase Cas3' [Metasolibacillus sp.]|uniref:CRISPR-associated helicase Cas3' n=1 Tax=Metasolibacillus sp. TaxID=2703680 RepID=UPI0025F823DB|nr:CRISPR-associated helicase Cas3' [Metasolibacillus sp.]MCT6942539.1 CRISPR-associated helicase Cas3' [Metasolibacillus sp.]
MFYAKSKPDVLTILEHTTDVVDAVKALSQAYGQELSLLNESDFLLLEFAAWYHDLGKYSVSFQNAIKPAIEKKYRRLDIHNYPHNYLSVTLIPIKRICEQFSKIDGQILTLAVGYHHERGTPPDKLTLETFYQKYMIEHLTVIQEDMPENLLLNLSEKPDKLAIKYLLERRNTFGDFDQNARNKYILIKGLLQRADHAASAKRKWESIEDYVEEAVHENVAENTKAFLEKRFSLRPLQQLTYENQHKNIILMAQTGSGKTEAALLWISQKKGFITLPLRVSLNAMYERIIKPDEIAFKSTGLFHSSALDYLLSEENKKKQKGSESFEQLELQVSHTRRLAKKLTLSTIDQLFKFPLLYRGFETELATLAYSKVVIDEIQAYDAHLVAILIKGIQMIQEIGGQWMIMTATLPKIFLEELQHRQLINENTLVETVLIPDDRSENPIIPRRHRIQLVEKSIEEMFEQITNLSQHAKVLVVVNTVKQALRLYDLLEGQCKLLHSQFTPHDRLPKESEIKNFAQLEDPKSGLWVTTQIVEASLDIDFDYLFTEAATPDALFQRFGRCNRQGKRFNGQTPLKPNIFISSDLENISGMDTVYEKIIVERGLEALKAFDRELLAEDDKIKIVEEVFSRESLEGTKYLDLFQRALIELDNMQPFEHDSNSVQKIMRDIQSTSFVAGRDNYEKVVELIEEYEHCKYAIEDQKELYQRRRQIRIDIDKYIISVNFHRLLHARDRQYSLMNFKNKGFEHIYYSTDVSYNAHRGLELALDENFDSTF